jgi:hypothetical protein
MAGCRLWPAMPGCTQQLRVAARHCTAAAPHTTDAHVLPQPDLTWPGCSSPSDPRPRPKGHKGTPRCTTHLCHTPVHHTPLPHTGAPHTSATHRCTTHLCHTPVHHTPLPHTILYASTPIASTCLQPATHGKQHLQAMSQSPCSTPNHPASTTVMLAHKQQGQHTSAGAARLA